jgi:transposase
MTQKDLNNWIMYHEIHRLQRLGFGISKIARYLKCNFRTVQKYLNMNDQEYEQFLINSSKRNKILDCYETFLKAKLMDYPDSTTAQLHDWLKEHHPDFPQVSPRTVFNFVMFLRQKHNIPLEVKVREYLPVEELPYGEQAQVDFGEYNMLTSMGKRKKVKFFVMVLSRSRMKFIWFLDKPFTSETVVIAHEKAFGFYQGIPRVLVYDQDRTIIVDENIGEIILTTVFKQYTKSRNFKLHFCRKSDPQSKGKVENVVQYVKKNFLYNRTFFDIENLNEEAIAWLGRTANYLPHNYTKKPPCQEFLIEKTHLSLFIPLAVEHVEFKLYNVRKTNVISYKSNFYMLPPGIYNGTGTQVNVQEIREMVHIYNLQLDLLCSYPLSTLKGQTIGSFNRQRDVSSKIDSLMDQLLPYFTEKTLAMKWLMEIKEKYPRYIRDHLLMIFDTLTKVEDKGTADKALAFCIKNSLINGMEFRDVYYCILEDRVLKKHVLQDIILFDKNNQEKINENPQVSNINDYEIIINQKNKK